MRGAESRRKISERATRPRTFCILPFSVETGPSARSQCRASFDSAAGEGPGEVRINLRRICLASHTRLATIGSVYPLIVGLESPRTYRTSSQQGLRARQPLPLVPRPTPSWRNQLSLTQWSCLSCSTLTYLVANVFPSLRFSTR